MNKLNKRYLALLLCALVVMTMCATWLFYSVQDRRITSTMERMAAKAIELVRADGFLATNFPPPYELSEHYLVDPSFVTTMVQRPVMEIFEELRT